MAPILGWGASKNKPVDIGSLNLAFFPGFASVCALLLVVFSRGSLGFDSPNISNAQLVEGRRNALGAYSAKMMPFDVVMT